VQSHSAQPSVCDVVYRRICSETRHLRQPCPPLILGRARPRGNLCRRSGPPHPWVVPDARSSGDPLISLPEPAPRVRPAARRGRVSPSDRPVRRRAIAQPLIMTPCSPDATHFLESLEICFASSKPGAQPCLGPARGGWTDHGTTKSTKGTKRKSINFICIYSL
jgi:hypothetical protein